MLCSIFAHHLYYIYSGILQIHGIYIIYALKHIVFVITDQTAIELITDNDLEGFKAYLAEEDTLYFSEPETFSTEEEVLAFCVGNGFGIDERAQIERLSLRSCEPNDVPFIEAIENY